MYRVRFATTFSVSLLFATVFFLSASLAHAQLGTTGLSDAPTGTSLPGSGTADDTANKQCPKPDQTHKYDSTKGATWIELVGGKQRVTITNLYGKHCEEMQASVKVKGFCTAQDKCKATSYVGQDGKEHSVSDIEKQIDQQTKPEETPPKTGEEVTKEVQDANKQEQIDCAFGGPCKGTSQPAEDLTKGPTSVTENPTAPLTTGERFNQFLSDITGNDFSGLGDFHAFDGSVLSSWEQNTFMPAESGGFSGASGLDGGTGFTGAPESTGFTEPPASAPSEGGFTQGGLDTAAPQNTFPTESVAPVEYASNPWTMPQGPSLPQSTNVPLPGLDGGSAPPPSAFTEQTGNAFGQQSGYTPPVNTNWTGSNQPVAFSDYINTGGKSIADAGFGVGGAIQQFANPDQQGSQPITTPIDLATVKSPTTVEFTAGKTIEDTVPVLALQGGWANEGSNFGRLSSDISWVNGNRSDIAAEYSYALEPGIVHGFWPTPAQLANGPEGPLATDVSADATAALPESVSVGSAPADQVTGLKDGETLELSGKPAIPSGGQSFDVTAYFPCKNAGACPMQGGLDSKSPGLDGESKVRTLDDYRLGKSEFVTGASDKSRFGETYEIQKITYKSALDGKTYTLENVPVYVHDTGAAFQGRPDKLDIAVGTANSDAQAMSLAKDQPFLAQRTQTYETISGQDLSARDAGGSVAVPTPEYTRAPGTDITAQVSGGVDPRLGQISGEVPLPQASPLRNTYANETPFEFGFPEQARVNVYTNETPFEWGFPDSSRTNEYAGATALETGYPDSQRENQYANAAPLESGYPDSQRENTYANATPLESGYPDVQRENPYAATTPLESGYPDSQRGNQFAGTQPLESGYPDSQRENQYANQTPLESAYPDSAKTNEYANATPLESGYPDSQRTNEYANATPFEWGFPDSARANTYAGAQSLESGFPDSSRTNAYANEHPFEWGFPDSQRQNAYVNETPIENAYPDSQRGNEYANATPVESGYPDSQRENKYANQAPLETGYQDSVTSGAQQADNSEIAAAKADLERYKNIDASALAGGQKTKDELIAAAQANLDNLQAPQSGCQLYDCAAAAKNLNTQLADIRAKIANTEGSIADIRNGSITTLPASEVVITPEEAAAVAEAQLKDLRSREEKIVAELKGLESGVVSPELAATLRPEGKGAQALDSFAGVFKSPVAANATANLFGNNAFTRGVDTVLSAPGNVIGGWFGGAVDSAGRLASKGADLLADNTSGTAFAPVTQGISDFFARPPSEAVQNTYNPNPVETISDVVNVGTAPFMGAPRAGLAVFAEGGTALTALESVTTKTSVSLADTLNARAAYETNQLVAAEQSGQIELAAQLRTNLAATEAAQQRLNNLPTSSWAPRVESFSAATDLAELEAANASKSSGQSTATTPPGGAVGSRANEIVVQDARTALPAEGRTVQLADNTLSNNILNTPTGRTNLQVFEEGLPKPQIRAADEVMRTIEDAAAAEKGFTGPPAARITVNAPARTAAEVEAGAAEGVAEGTGVTGGARTSPAGAVPKAPEPPAPSTVQTAEAYVPKQAVPDPADWARAPQFRTGAEPVAPLQPGELARGWAEVDQALLERGFASLNPEAVPATNLSGNIARIEPTPITNPIRPAVNDNVITQPVQRAVGDGLTPPTAPTAQTPALSVVPKSIEPAPIATGPLSTSQEKELQTLLKQLAEKGKTPLQENQLGTIGNVRPGSDLAEPIYTEGGNLANIRPGLSTAESSANPAADLGKVNTALERPNIFSTDTFSQSNAAKQIEAIAGKAEPVAAVEPPRGVRAATDATYKGVPEVTSVPKPAEVTLPKDSHVTAKVSLDSAPADGVRVNLNDANNSLRYAEELTPAQRQALARNADSSGRMTEIVVSPEDFAKLKAGSGDVTIYPAPKPAYANAVDTGTAAPLESAASQPSFFSNARQKVSDLWNNLWGGKPAEVSVLGTDVNTAKQTTIAVRSGSEVSSSVGAQEYTLSAESPVSKMYSVSVNDLPVGAKFDAAPSGEITLYRGLGNAYDRAYVGAEPYFTRDLGEALNYARANGTDPHIVVIQMDTQAYSDLLTYRTLQATAQERPIGLGEMTNGYAQLPNDWLSATTKNPSLLKDIDGVSDAYRQSTLESQTAIQAALDERAAAYQKAFLENRASNPNWDKLSTQDQDKIVYQSLEYVEAQKHLDAAFISNDAAKKELAAKVVSNTESDINVVPTPAQQGLFTRAWQGAKDLWNDGFPSIGKNDVAALNPETGGVTPKQLELPLNDQPVLPFPKQEPQLNASAPSQQLQLPIPEARQLELPLAQPDNTSQNAVAFNQAFTSWQSRTIMSATGQGLTIGLPLMYAGWTEDATTNSGVVGGAPTGTSQPGDAIYPADDIFGPVNIESKTTPVNADVVPKDLQPLSLGGVRQSLGLPANADIAPSGLQPFSLAGVKGALGLPANADVAPNGIQPLTLKDVRESLGLTWNQPPVVPNPKPRPQEAGPSAADLAKAAAKESPDSAAGLSGILSSLSKTPIFNALGQFIGKSLLGGNSTNNGASAPAAQQPATTPTPSTPASVVTITANPNPVTSGQPTVLTWSAVGPSTCSVFDPNNATIGTGSPSGSTTTAPITTQTVFKVTCSGGTDAANNQVTVTTK